jgi:hypothetical protein
LGIEENKPFLGQPLHGIRAIEITFQGGLGWNAPGFNQERVAGLLSFGDILGYLE